MSDMSGNPGASANLSPKAFEVIASLAKSEAGIILTPAKTTMVQSRLRGRIRAVGHSGFDEYAKFVSSEQGLAERREMISALTTNVSHFFREPHHFDMLRDQALPILRERARNGGRVRIWSAGCSSGQEPYSIAMTLLEHAPEMAQKDVLILASDIDPQILAKAKAGAYSEQQIGGIPEAYLKKYMHKSGSDFDVKYEVDPALKKLVRFRELNLLRDWPMSGGFDVVFCRNVVIYFDAPTQASLWPRFHKMLGKDAWFFLGHSERISDCAQPLFKSIGLTAYHPAA